MSDPAISSEPNKSLIGASWHEQDVVLREMWMDGKAPEAISEVIGRSVSAIMTRAARLGLPRRKAPGRKPRPELPHDMQNGQTQASYASAKTATKEERQSVKKASPENATADVAASQSAPRICLMCLRTFQSVGRHNRICVSCKNSSEYAAAATLPDIQIPNS